MNVKVKMEPASVIKARLGIQKGGKAHKFFTATCFRYMSSFVPGGISSHLNQSVDLEVDKIIYKSPSAKYLYCGKLMVDPKTGKGAFYSPDFGYWSRPAKYGIAKEITNQDLKYHTPGTGAHWDKRMWTSKGNEVIKEVQAYLDRGCK